MPVFEQEQLVPADLPKVFAFFSAAENLQRLTPTQLNFKILTPTPIEIKQGCVIDYRLSLYGVPFGWRTLIEAFEVNEMFVDRQLKGPYKLWRHTHVFEARTDGTWMYDRVEYEVGFGPVGTLARHLFVDRQIAQIFAHRRAVLSEIFPGS